MWIGERDLGAARTVQSDWSEEIVVKGVGTVCLRTPLVHYAMGPPAEQHSQNQAQRIHRYGQSAHSCGSWGFRRRGMLNVGRRQKFGMRQVAGGNMHTARKRRIGFAYGRCNEVRNI